MYYFICGSEIRGNCAALCGGFGDLTVLFASDVSTVSLAGVRRYRESVGNEEGAIVKDVLQST